MKNNYLKYGLCCLILVHFSCKKEMSSNKDMQIEEKVEALLSQMTLEEKIGQMSQIRHFEESADAHIKEKFIGSVIHTQGTLPGKTALDWQKKIYPITEGSTFY